MAQLSEASQPIIGTLSRAAFAHVPIALLADKRRGRMVVYGWLWHFAGVTDTAFPAIDRLAGLCHMKPDDVRGTIKWLTAEGWIERIDRPGQTTLFHVRSELSKQSQRAPLPQMGDPLNGGPHPSPIQGSPPLPHLGETNKNHLTRTKEQEELDPCTDYVSTPPTGGTHGQALNAIPQQHQQQPPPFASGTLVADPQPQQAAPQDPNAPSPPSSRVKHPAPSIPTHQHPEAPSWPSQAPLVAIAPSSAKAPPKPRDRFASKVLSPDAIPDDLLDCQQLLPEWWSVKAKGRTEVAFNRACNLLRRFSPDERRQVLETAIIGGHQGLYEPRETRPSGGKQGRKTEADRGLESMLSFLDRMEGCQS